MESTRFVLVCEGCGRFEYDDEYDIYELVDFKEHACTHLSNAELLKRIHEHKTNHRPYIRTVVREDHRTVDEHVPAWAEGGVRDEPR